MGGCGRGRRRWGASFHALDVADHVIQRRVVCEDKVLVNGQTEFVPDVRHDFRLLDRVNAQLSLKVLVEFNEVRRVARVFNHHGHNRRRHRCIIHRGGWSRCCGRWSSRGRGRGRFGCGWSGRGRRR